MSKNTTPNHPRGCGMASLTPPTPSLSGELPGDGRRSPPAKGGPEDETGDSRERTVTAVDPAACCRPNKRRKKDKWRHDLGARLLSESTGKNPPLSLLHKECMQDLAGCADTRALICARDCVMPILRIVAIDHKYAAMVLRSDRHALSVLRSPRCFDNETYIWRAEDGRGARYIASGCTCRWCHCEKAPLFAAS